jgi:hypothetical protein
VHVGGTLMSDARALAERLRTDPTSIGPTEWPLIAAVLEEAADAAEDTLVLEKAAHRAHDFLAELNWSEFSGDGTRLVKGGMVREALRSALGLELDEIRQIMEVPPKAVSA